VSGVADIGGGRPFHHRLFPDGAEPEQTAAWLADLIADHAALELGVGTGRVALPLSERIGDVVGVDSSPEMLAVLRRSLAVSPRPVVPVHGDIRDYTDGRGYGLVYCLGDTLSALLDPADQQKVLDRCADALAPGGTVVLETRNPAAVDALHGGRPWESFLLPYAGKDTGLLAYCTREEDSQIWNLSYVWFEEGRAHTASEVSRLTEPEELDAYADRAGLSLHGRYGDWRGTPFTGTEPMVISAYRAQGDR
jgi:SAM-dependent methyltransferase